MNPSIPFYRGGLDDRVTTAENGARVNRDYAAFVIEGPWSKVKTWEVSPRIHSVVGYGMANYTFIEGDTGLILVDTGQNIGAALEVLKMKQVFSDKPVVAIIYTHFHYTRGTRAIVESYPEIDIPIFGHPGVDVNMLDVFSYLAPGRMQRGVRQFGQLLPKEGPDAEYSISEPHFDDPTLNAPGHMPVTQPVADGEEIVIDGLKVVFHHAIADTEDSLIIHVPEFDLVVHNTAVMPFMFPMYTLRGDYYRHTPSVLDSIDVLREIKPKYLIGCHGEPIIGHDNTYEFATAHRDALAYVYQQTVRGMNRGLGPDEIAPNIQLPSSLADIPELFPAYVDVEHMARGIYRGLIGWWANDGTDLHPPSAEEIGSEIVEGFGGAEVVLARAERVLHDNRYNLAAKLASYVLADDPQNTDAKHIKAAAFRKMAYATPTGIQTRNFLLYEALELEGGLPASSAGVNSPITMSPQMIAAMPPGPLLETLAYKIDGARAADLVAAVKIDLSDIQKSYTLVIRYGAAEFIESAPETFDLRLKLDTNAWAELFLGQQRLVDLINSDRAEFSGEDTLKTAFMAAYHEAF